MITVPCIGIHSTVLLPRINELTCLFPPPQRPEQQPDQHHRWGRFPGAEGPLFAVSLLLYSLYGI